MKLYGPITIATAAATSGGQLTATNVSGAGDPAAYAAGTTYALAARVTVGETIYQSAQAANTGHTPATSPDWWAEVGVINKLAMFDRRVATQTTNATSIDATVTLQNECIDTVSVFNADAASIAVTQTDPVDGLVYSQTQLMDEPVGDWWEYLYYPIVRKPVALFIGLLPYRNSLVNIVLSNPGSTAKVGLVSMGQATEPGDAQWGASDGIQDFSTIKDDTFGIRDIVERDYADDADFVVQVPEEEAPRFRRILAERRAKATVFILADSRPDAQYVGLPSFRRVLQYPGLDVFSVTVKGFT